MDLQRTHTHTYTHMCARTLMHTRAHAHTHALLQFILGGILLVNLVLAVIYVNYERQQNGAWARPLYGLMQLRDEYTSNPFSCLCPFPARSGVCAQALVACGVRAQRQCLHDANDGSTHTGRHTPAAHHSPLPHTRAQRKSRQSCGSSVRAAV